MVRTGGSTRKSSSRDGKFFGGVGLAVGNLPSHQGWVTAEEQPLTLSLPGPTLNCETMNLIIPRKM